MSSDEITRLEAKIDAIPGEVLARLAPHLTMLSQHDDVLYGPNKDDGLVTDMKEAKEIVKFIKGAGGKLVITVLGIILVALFYLVLEHPYVVKLP